MSDTLGELSRDRAAAFGDRVAVTFENRDLTYGDLDAAANRVAHALLRDGVRKGDRIAILDKNSVEVYELIFGAAKVGAVLCPINWRLAPVEVAHLMNDAQARIIVVGEEFVPVLEKIEDDLPNVERSLVIGARPDREEYAVWRDRCPADDPAIKPGADDVVLQFYTSGTTGTPKGVMHSFRGLTALAEPYRELLGYGPDTVVLVVLPLFHTAGMGASFFAFDGSARIVLMRDVDLGVILDAIPRYDVTDAWFVPALLQFLLATPGCESTDFSSLRTIMYSASPIPEEVLLASIERFGCRFIQAYGLTEVGSVVLPPEDHDPAGPNRHRLRSAGKALPGVELRVVDARGDQLPAGEIGEVWIRSPMMMVGYWRLPEATAAALTPDGWFKTGDAGYLDDDGYLYIVDRVKDLVISGGENVYPAEVENVLMAHPGVGDAAVIGVPDERWGEALKAILVRAPDVTVTADEVIAWCRQRLAHFKCPASVDWTEVLPRNPSGKILKRELRERYRAESERKA